MRGAAGYPAAALAVAMSDTRTDTHTDDLPPTRFDAVLEVVIGALVIALVAWTGFSSWRLYTAALLPQARTVPTATPTPAKDPEEIRQEARRFRQVSDHVGAGIAFRQAGRADLAQQEFLAALAIDPANFEARQNLSEMGIEPPAAVATTTPPVPIATVIPTVTPRP